MFTDHGWQEPEIIRVPEDYRSLVGGHPLVAETLFRRGIHSPQAVRAFLDPNLYLPSSPFELQDLRSAVDLVAEAVSKGTAICVWGDFDVDGQSSTTLLVEALRGLGANVRYYIPDREVESHGFHPASLRLLLEQGIGLVITCDTGVTGQEAVDVAREFGAQR
jgi:single-stranded-DNA-specific exonuclease